MSKPVDKLEEAKKLLLEEQQKKAQACAEEVNAVLAKHGYIIVSGPATLQVK